MSIIFLTINILNPLLTCLKIKNYFVRFFFQIALLIFSLSLDTYFYFQSQITEARKEGGYWPWGRAGVTKETIDYRANGPWNVNDYSFIDHLDFNHYYYIFLSGLAFYSYIYFFTKIYDHFKSKV